MEPDPRSSGDPGEPDVASDLAGDAKVAAARDVLATLDDPAAEVSLDRHPEVYEHVHAELRAALSAVDDA